MFAVMQANEGQHTAEDLLQGALVKKTEDEETIG